ncbi:hypothetical protein OEA41_002386 [Lepraria neglecta]|uniref:Uncharacterized protein n=1 Tax=Lepraria neglecta TaxID=209136 RepID=A0AAE0DMN0_9LECA|nr:hypothetical protein OEA41_002386 [Lepraria neglecta]
MLAQVCSYKYTDANININILEGDDADCLKDFWCPQLDMGFYLAKLERIGEGGCETFSEFGDYGTFHPIDFATGDSATLTEAFELDGTLVAKSTHLDVLNNVAQDDLSGNEPDEEDYDSYNANVTHYYRDLVLVMFPSMSSNSFFKRHVKSAQGTKRRRETEVVDLS